MAMTITEKILAAHCGKKQLGSGDLIEANVDLAFGNDITAPVAIDEFHKAGLKKVFDNDKVMMLADHFTPCKDIKTAQQVKKMKEFEEEHKLTNRFEIGRIGIEHAFLPEQGFVVSGDVVIGADSHTCTYGALGAFSTGVGSTDLAAAMATGRLWFKVPESMLFSFSGKLGKWVSGKDLILYTIGQIGVDGALYRAMEFKGETIDNLSMDSRFSMCNMAIEAGGKSGIIAPDAKTKEYLKGRAKHPPVYYESDKDAEYVEKFEWDASKIEPQVSVPDLPENAKPVSEVKGIHVDQVVIGSCTNGRMEDLREAAEVLKGKKAKEGLKLIIFPATPAIYRQAMDEGLFRIFLEAEATISPPTCGPCLGGHMGILAEGEAAIATTNRNFRGRMGHPESKVYLSNPAIAAASAVKGEIASPDDLG